MVEIISVACTRRVAAGTPVGGILCVIICLGCVSCQTGDF